MTAAQTGKGHYSQSARAIRESRNLDIVDVAIATGVSSVQLAAIESAKVAIPRGVLKRLSKYYAVPEYFFYIDDLEIPKLALPDFRSPTNASMRVYGQLAGSIQRANEIRDILSEGFDVLEGVSLKWGAFPVLSQEMGVVVSAKILRDYLSLHEKVPSSFETTKLYLDWIRGKAEKGGIVTIFENFGEDGARGYCIAHDNRIPFISLNTRNQSPESRVFTFVHELVHVALRNTGVSDPFATRNTLERFCNRVAAQVLMPDDLFVSFAETVKSNSMNEFVRVVSQYFKVSQQAVALKCVETGVRDQGFYIRWLSQFTTDYDGQANFAIEKVVRISKDEGKRKIAKFGTTLPILLNRLFERRFLSAMDIHRISGIKHKYLAATYSAAVKRLTELGLNER